MNTAPPRLWQGIPGIERTPGGRLFVTWFSGGEREPAPDNTIFLTTSDDAGRTFAAPVVMAWPERGMRTFDPTLWLDPVGRLWLIYNRGNKETATHGVFARRCDQPDAPTPTWSAEWRVGFDAAPFSFRMNKLTVLATGEWLLPVTHAREVTHDWFARATQLQGVAISSDAGQSWRLEGAVVAPPWALENMLVELRDGRVWMLIRTGAGVVWESFSADRGRTWSPGVPTTIANPGSRFFIRRLSSGNLLLVNHYRFTGRSHLTAQLSTDDGQTWNEGLLLDERANVSYPDGVQDASGLIWLVYDRDRGGAGEILLATCREADILAGRLVSSGARLKVSVDRLCPGTG
ncbi:MAG: hypothetical protein PCFJNLEI_02183 [Verrucomicrobiae bacterium]|nr:hypothetical protein [Verrucomicrobiae bacterium]